MPRPDWQALRAQLEGELHTDELSRRLYATDASVYRALPLGVAYPRHEADVQALVRFARAEGLPLIPRAAGTSLAGQCVGEGLVLDVSRHMAGIGPLAAGRIRVGPGLVRDALNRHLAPHGLHFGPDTSTANRCTIGGMIGNNSCGASSIVYGSTRDKVLSLRAVLSDGSVAEFGPLGREAFWEKMALGTLEGALYRQVHARLAEPSAHQRIREGYPKPSVRRRNTGYAVDALLDNVVFGTGEAPFSFCPLLCGSEGTLAIITAATLQLDPLPPPHEALLCAHFDSVGESLRATLLAMRAQPSACELMDKTVLDCTRDNREQAKNRFFLQGEPAAVLMVAFRAGSPAEARALAAALAETLGAAGLGRAFPIVEGRAVQQVWALRKAGLGVLSNLPGDAKPVACIEDTAVALEDLPAYIAEVERMMAAFGQKAVYYAHAGAGELHLRPILNLKQAEGQRQFEAISLASAHLVKRYGGALSGEHGDGRLRAPFLPLMIGEDNYALLRDIKHTWDPAGILNPGKIIDPKPLLTDLRYVAGREEPDIATFFDFSASQGILRAAEQCNGSGDCRKMTGNMCPSYMATREERHTTRARANALREYLTASAASPAPFAHPELKAVLDLCIACKACASECPSNVDMATMKAEFLYQYQQRYRPSRRDWVLGHVATLQGWAALWPWAANALLALGGRSLKAWLGLAPERPLPRLGGPPLGRWWRREARRLPAVPPRGRLCFFADEFTRHQDTHLGRAALHLLAALGYAPQPQAPAQSGRALISKGFLVAARACAERNVRALAPLVSADCPLVGLEPSAILSFVDEYPKLVRPAYRAEAEHLARHSMDLCSFLRREAEAGRIGPADFDAQPREIWLHVHCHQKALGKAEDVAFVLGLPAGHQVRLIESACCGMAGGFGYEAEHFGISRQMAELALLPALRSAPPSALLAATGTSCRQQIADFGPRPALHPVEILRSAVRGA